MPTYEYRCPYCDTQFEEVQSINSIPRALCPKCGRYTNFRLISKIGGIIFKGSGWTGKDNKEHET